MCSIKQLNRFIERAQQAYAPARLQGKRLRIYYLTQVATHPPRFVLFVNSPALMQESYRKYLLNQLRKEHGFIGVPVLFHLKGKEDRRLEERGNTTLDDEGLEEWVMYQDFESEAAPQWSRMQEATERT